MATGDAVACGGIGCGDRSAAQRSAPGCVSGFEPGNVKCGPGLDRCVRRVFWVCSLSSGALCAAILDLHRSDSRADTFTKHSLLAGVERPFGGSALQLVW